VVSQQLIVSPTQSQNGAALAADAGYLIVRLFGLHVFLPSPIRVDQGDGLQKVCVLYPSQDLLHHHCWLCASDLPLDASIPIVAQAEVFRSVCCGQQLEGVEDYAAGVHFLEYVANGFLLDGLFQLDHGDLVGLETLQNLGLKAHEEFGFRRIEFPILEIPVLPVECVEQLLARKMQLFEFLLARGQVELHVCQGAHNSSLWHPDNRILAVLSRGQRAHHIEIKPALDGLLAHVHRCDDTTVGCRLEQ
jgi:hypothetical protein